MIISSEEAVKRLDSPLNLMNRIRDNGHASSSTRSRAMELFGIGKKKENSDKIEAIPYLLSPQPSDNDHSSGIKVPEVLIPEESNVEDIIDDANAKIKLSLAHDAALDTLVKSLQTINGKLDEIPPKQLVSVASATSKIVNEIRTERNKTVGTKSVHLHFYSPEQKKISDYEEVTV